MLASADVTRRKNLQHLVYDQRAANPKHRVSWPPQARWAAFSLWGDKRGDKRPLARSISTDYVSIIFPVINLVVVEHIVVPGQAVAPP